MPDITQIEENIDKDQAESLMKNIRDLLENIGEDLSDISDTNKEMLDASTKKDKTLADKFKDISDNVKDYTKSQNEDSKTLSKKVLDGLESLSKPKGENSAIENIFNKLLISAEKHNKSLVKSITTDLPAALSKTIATTTKSTNDVLSKLLGVGVEEATEEEEDEDKLAKEKKRISGQQTRFSNPEMEMLEKEIRRDEFDAQRRKERKAEARAKELEAKRLRKKELEDLKKANKSEDKMSVSTDKSDVPAETKDKSFLDNIREAAVDASGLTTLRSFYIKNEEDKKKEIEKKEKVDAEILRDEQTQNLRIERKEDNRLKAVAKIVDAQFETRNDILRDGFDAMIAAQGQFVTDSEPKGSVTTNHSGGSGLLSKLSKKVLPFLTKTFKVVGTALVKVLTNPATLAIGAAVAAGYAVKKHIEGTVKILDEVAAVEADMDKTAAANRKAARDKKLAALKELQQEDNSDVLQLVDTKTGEITDKAAFENLSAEQKQTVSDFARESANERFNLSQKAAREEFERANAAYESSRIGVFYDTSDEDMVGTDEHKALMKARAKLEEESAKVQKFRQTARFAKESIQTSEAKAAKIVPSKMLDRNIAVTESKIMQKEMKVKEKVADKEDKRMDELNNINNKQVDKLDNVNSSIEKLIEVVKNSNTTVISKPIQSLKPRKDTM